MNARPGTDVMKIFEPWWTVALPFDPGATTDPGPTTASRRPRLRGDHVLFRPARGWRQIESRFIDDTVTSDHRPGPGRPRVDRNALATAAVVAAPTPAALVPPAVPVPPVVVGDDAATAFPSTGEIPPADVGPAQPSTRPHTVAASNNRCATRSASPVDTSSPQPTYRRGRVGAARGTRAAEAARQCECQKRSAHWRPRRKRAGPVEIASV